MEKVESLLMLNCILHLQRTLSSTSIEEEDEKFKIWNSKFLIFFSLNNLSSLLQRAYLKSLSNLKITYLKSIFIFTVYFIDFQINMKIKNFTQKLNFFELFVFHSRMNQWSILSNDSNSHSFNHSQLSFQIISSLDLNLIEINQIKNAQSQNYLCSVNSLTRTQSRGLIYLVLKILPRCNFESLAWTSDSLHFGFIYSVLHLNPLLNWVKEFKNLKRISYYGF